MSEHPRVERRDLKKIFVCDDVWFGVFAFLDCELLGLKCALLSSRFDALVYKHLKGKDWSLCCLEICRAENGNGARICKIHFDQNVINFLECISRLFNNAIMLKLYMCDQNNSWNILT
ncbi:hypothetical protein GPALN_003363 [Globodera pallida]|nr:hypothetical protein GPALN_003363 [Globodera pallida]